MRIGYQGFSPETRTDKNIVRALTLFHFPKIPEDKTVPLAQQVFSLYPGGLEDPLHAEMLFLPDPTV